MDVYRPRLRLRRSRRALGRQKAREPGANFAVLQAVVDGRLHVAQLAAAIVAAAFERVRKDAFLGEQAGDAVGELDLAAGARMRGAQMMKDSRREDVTADDRQR